MILMMMIIIMMMMTIMRKFSDLCVLLLFQGKFDKMLPNPGLVNQFSATLRSQLNWTGPNANGSDSY